MSATPKSTKVGPTDPKSTPLDTSLEMSSEPTMINSLDARILQYMYAISKLEAYTKSIRRLIDQCTKSTKSNDQQPSQSNIDTDTSGNDTTTSTTEAPKPLASEDLALVNYIISLSGTLFSINESAFHPRLAQLSQYNLFKPTQINVSPLATHIPYDAQDTVDDPLLHLPTAATGIKCLRVLLNLCTSCLQGYQKRFELAKMEKEKYDGAPSEYYDKLTTIINSEVFNADTDVDLTLRDLTFGVPKDPNLAGNETFAEACLVDIDIKMIPLITQNLLWTLSKLKVQLARFKNLKNNASKTAVTNFNYSLHKIFVLTLRINDIYTIFRKFGRRIYLSNTLHLTDQKFLYQTRNPSYFRSTVLGSMDDIFNATKKNGPLIATLTRFIRLTAHFEVTVKNILDFINFISQTQLLVESYLQKFDEFGNTWMISEMRFRKVYQLPRRNLLEIYHFSNTLKSKLFDIPITTAAKTTDGKSTQESIEKDLKKLDINPSTETRSRLSSLSSLQSNGSGTGVNLGRKNSVSSPRRNSLIITQFANNLQPAPSASSPNKPRPASALFLNSNSSLTSLDSNVLHAKPTPAVTGRRRSNSQPTKLDSDLLKAAGIKPPSDSLRSPSGSIRSPTGSIRSPSGSIRSTSGSIRSPMQRKIQHSATDDAKNQGSQSLNAANGTNRIQKQLLAVAEEDSEHQGRPVSQSQASSAAAAAIAKKQSTQLTATQRFQQHVKEAAKSGSLMTQQKETFTSVSFDPNNPSGYGLRKESPEKESDTPKENGKEPSKEDAPEPIKQRPGFLVSPRDIVTRRNTQRNSGLNIADTESAELNLTLDSTSTSSVSSHEPAANGTVVKRVRFIGVPEYTEEEDRPSTYSSRILNRFAVFSTPKLTNHQQVYKKRDQWLVQEGLEFRHQLHADDTKLGNAGVLAASQFLGLNATNTGFGRTGRLSKIKNKII